MLVNDKQTGKFPETVNQELDHSYWKSQTSQPKDATELMNELLSIRRSGDHKYIDVSAQSVKRVFKIAVETVEKAFEKNERVTNSGLSEEILVSFDDKKTEVAQKAQGMEEFLQLAFDPSVQSGENIDFRHQVVSSDTQFQRSNCVLSVAMKYLGFNTQATRTVFVNPSEDMVESYNILHEALKYAGLMLVPGTELKDVHAKVAAFLAEKRHTWSEKINVTFGNGIGLLRREVNRTINSKCSAKVRDRDVYYLCIGVKEIENKAGKKYGIVLGDTVRVDGTRGVEVLTDNLIPKHVYHIEVKRPVGQSRENSNTMASTSSRRLDKQKDIQKRGNLDEETHRSSSANILADEDSLSNIYKPTTRAQLRRLNGEEPQQNGRAGFVENQKSLHKLKLEELKTRLEQGKFILPGELK